MQGKHGLQLDDAGMEVPKNWDERNVLEITRVANKMLAVLDQSAEQEDPKIDDAS